MVNIRVIGALVNLLFEIAPEVYKTYARKDKKGNNILILICLNAMYKRKNWWQVFCTI